MATAPPAAGRVGPGHLGLVRIVAQCQRVTGRTGHSRRLHKGPGGDRRRALRPVCAVRAQRLGHRAAGALGSAGRRCRRRSRVWCSTRHSWCCVSRLPWRSSCSRSPSGVPWWAVASTCWREESDRSRRGWGLQQRTRSVGGSAAYRRLLSGSRVGLRRTESTDCCCSRRSRVRLRTDRRSPIRSWTNVRNCSAVRILFASASTEWECSGTSGRPQLATGRGEPDQPLLRSLEGLRPEPIQPRPCITNE